MSPVVERIGRNLANVKQRIAEAARRAQRQPADVRLVAVTKYASEQQVQALVQAGCVELGESRPQQLWQRAVQFEQRAIVWHLIGHLQTNKIRRSLACFNWLHSADRRTLLAALDQEAGRQQQHVNVLLEVNISGERAKHGFRPADMEAELVACAGYSWLRVQGLMAMASRTGATERARRDFGALRQLRDGLRPLAPENVCLEELSMGMSGDFSEAIEEGATMVRVGSALLQGSDS